MGKPQLILYQKNLTVVYFSIYFFLFISSCGFPGRIFIYNRSSDVVDTSAVKVIIKTYSYFCFDYDMDCECQFEKRVLIDTVRNKMVSKRIRRGTALYMFDGRKKIIGKVFEYDSLGNISKKKKYHFQTYGIGGRVKYSREVEYLSYGDRRVTIKRGTRRNPEKLIRTRVILGHQKVPDVDY
jgi:hypothetical protein